MDGITLVNGYTLATLACEYVEAISKPGAVPDLDQGWQAVVCLEVKQYCDKLVGEYKTEMEELLQHNMPMEESRLMRLHHEALCGKKKAFEEEIHRVSPVYSTDRKIFPLIHELEREIVQWNDEGKPVVVGRVLFHFLTENYAVSKEHCKKVFSDLLKESEIEAKTNTAILDSQPFNIGEEISVISARYNTMALGPAATGVMERGQLELQQLRDTLKMIPGKPCNLKYVGISTDRIKLSWDPPFYNTDAVESFIVLRRAEGEEWEEVKRTENTKALITGLKSNTNYTFQVRATNALLGMLSMPAWVLNAITCQHLLILAG